MRHEPDRRQFLQAGGLAATALPSSSRFAFAEGVSDRKIRIGVVGGNFGRSFYWHEHPNGVVEAVSDLRPERRDALQQTYRCTKSYESLEKLILDPRIEAVAVFTPAPDHVRHVLACLKAGKHVICAVPAAMSLEECQALVDGVKRSGLTYMMAETSYYQQPTISARRMFQIRTVRRDLLHRVGISPRRPGDPLVRERPTHLAVRLPADALPDPLHGPPVERDRRTAHVGELPRLGRRRPVAQGQRI